MSGAMSHEEVKKHVRGYLVVFVALLALTAVTVGISYLHLPKGQTILLALLVATAKGGLVALYFMHLVNERKCIYWVLGLTAVLFAMLMCTTLFL